MRPPLNGGTLGEGKDHMEAVTHPSTGQADEPSARVEPEELHFTLRGVELTWFVPFLAYQAHGRASAGLVFLGVTIALRILTSVHVTVGTDLNGPYYITARLWQSRRRATRITVAGASLTHWSSALFCCGFDLRGPTSALHIGTKGSRTPKAVAGLRAVPGKRPSFSPNAKSLLFNLPNIIVLAWSTAVVRDVVGWQAVAVPLLSLTGIAFSLGACLLGVPFVRASATRPL
jgi:hypothetical protein